MIKVCFTLLVVQSDVAVLVQKLLHAAQCDGRLVCGVFQLQQSLKIRRGLTAAQIHTLTIHSIQPAIQSIH